MLVVLDHVAQWLTAGAVSGPELVLHKSIRSWHNLLGPGLLGLAIKVRLFVVLDHVAQWFTARAVSGPEFVLHKSIGPWHNLLSPGLLGLAVQMGLLVVLNHMAQWLPSWAVSGPELWERGTVLLTTAIMVDSVRSRGHGLASSSFIAERSISRA